MAEHWKHRATRCAVPGCDRTRRKGWSTCSWYEHYDVGVSLYGLKRGAPRLTSAAVTIGEQVAENKRRADMLDDWDEREAYRMMREDDV